MDKLVANVDDIKFNIEVALEVQAGTQPLIFVGMDKSLASFCVRDLKKECQLGDRCPYRHEQKNRNVVCKHWLKRLCKKGDKCEFLHEYDLEKMPECHFFFSKLGCDNKECPFRHDEKRLNACPWYARGFCRHGAACKSRHERKVLCQNYALGFCLDGPNCQNFHPRFELPVSDSVTHNSIRCHSCGEMGHKSTSCPSQKKDEMPIKPIINQFVNNGQPRRRPLHLVTCNKCGLKGHYANACTTFVRRVPYKIPS